MKSVIRSVILCAYLVATQALAEPFTYQGQLQDNGAPATGLYDLSFRLFTASSGGLQIGSTLQLDNKAVTDGLFQTPLDFGPGTFDGSPRYLAVSVRDGASVGAYTPLLPRTQITNTPEAQHALIADQVANPFWKNAPTPGTIFRGLGQDKVFINRSQGITATEYFGFHKDTAGFVGMFISGPTGALPYYGYSVNGLISAYTYYDASNSQWSLVTGGLALKVDANQDLTVTNNAIANNFKYPTPKAGVTSVSGDAFHSASGDAFGASQGSGGAFITTPGEGHLVAPVQLPQGAIVTKVTAYFVDNSTTANLSISLESVEHTNGFFLSLAELNTSGASSSFRSLTDTTIDNSTIDHNTCSYHLRVYSANWSSSINMWIKSVVIEYTTTQAD